jgi:mannose-6-phosphate isomerase-like protein (cupin superfamily)
MDWTYQSLPAAPSYIAPDGSEIRELVKVERGSMAHFRLAAGRTSKAVAHHTVDELWYVTSGRGQMWLSSERDDGRIIDLQPGVSIAIPPKTRFQFRATGEQPLDVVGVTMPKWPGAHEAYEVEGAWTPHVKSTE